MTGLVILIPAAGSAARMQGRDKLLERVDGMPLLRRQVGIAQALKRPVRVTLPQDRPARRAALDGLEGVNIATLSQAREGLAASLRDGGAWASEMDANGLMILLADLPELTERDLRTLAQAYEKAPETPIRATDSSGKPGHPVILPARLFKRLEKLRGDAGAKALLEGETVTRIALPGRHATTDLDTPEDWAAWRARTGQAPF